MVHSPCNSARRVQLQIKFADTKMKARRSGCPSCICCCSHYFCTFILCVRLSSSMGAELTRRNENKNCARNCPNRRLPLKNESYKLVLFATLIEELQINTTVGIRKARYRLLDKSLFVLVLLPYLCLLECSFKLRVYVNNYNSTRHIACILWWMLVIFELFTAALP